MTIVPEAAPVGLRIPVPFDLLSLPDNLTAPVAAAFQGIQRVARTPRVDLNALVGVYGSSFQSSSTLTLPEGLGRDSAFDLRIYAERRLANVRSRGLASPSDEALASFRTVTRLFIQAGGPTPQVGSTPSGSIEIQWLTGGTLVSALFDRSGDYNLYGEDPRETVLFDVDVEAGVEPTDTIREKVQATLAEMSEHVKVRPSSW